MTQEMITLTGRFTHILYRNEDTFYTVAKFKIYDLKEKTITVTGTLASSDKDILYEICGSYIEHPRYGMQFQIQTCTQQLPSEKDAVVRYLSGIQFPGIGNRTAMKIADTLGNECLSLIRRDPAVLKKVTGLSAEKAQVIQNGLAQQSDGLEDLIQFLNVHGLGMRNLVRLNRAYGKEALQKLKENPYRVIEECDGFGFATADKIAMSLGIEKDDPRRIYAYLVSLTMELCMQSGDSFVMTDQLETVFYKRLNGTDADFDDLLQKAVMKQSLVLEDSRVYPYSQYEAEQAAASFLASYPESKLEPVDFNLLHSYLDALQKDCRIEYDEDQVQAIESFFKDDLLIMTGGPGTGKTTVVRAMVQLFRMMYPESEIICCAPTGRAAKRLAQLTETKAVTIHSLLKWDLETNTFGKNEEDPICADLLIADEFSMVDAHLFAHLLKAGHQLKKICLIGDEDQLPSVSPGCVLRDLIDSKCFPLVRLTHIYRQKQGSDVIALAHQIHEGKTDFSQLNQDVAFLECKGYEVKNNVLQIVQNALDKGYEMNDIQVLSAMYNGPEGIDVLNNALQSCFNPKKDPEDELRVGYTVFRMNDKILQLKNQPDDDVYNGDIGVLVEVVHKNENGKPSLTVRFEDSFVEYGPDTFGNITLAYCISIHKSQGSEYPIVILPVTSRQGIMLQRKLLYTGVTRARRSLILLGEKDAFQKGIETLDRHPRQTTLRERIQKLCRPEKNGNVN